MISKHTYRIRRLLAGVVACLMLVTAALGSATEMSYAKATTVTIKVGSLEKYGTYSTYWRWVTHIDGEPIDLEDEAGVTRSYAYCVQPSLATPASGEYSVTVVDDDDSGRVAKMRKMIYYLPGAYGYKKIGKSRWFINVQSGTSAYALGHIALSYLYDNCREETDAFMGVSDADKKKVKTMVSDLANLADPPEDFEVFWVKVSGSQDTFGAFYRTEYGKVTVSKTSTLPQISDKNRSYSLAGAKYTLYEDRECKIVARTSKDRDAIITTKEDGSSDPIEVEIGEYYIRETTAPRGYVLNEGVGHLEVKKDRTVTYSDEDVPKSNPIEILIRKIDKETGLGRAQGAATLEGAEFTVRYYDEDGTDGEALASWIFRTDNEGRVDMSKPEQYLIEERSSDLYRNSEGKVVIPIGTITIQETRAPEGYCINSTSYVRRIADDGTTEQLETLQPLVGDASIREQVIRGDVCFTKSVDGGRRLANVPFRITSVKTGESHIVVTDANGYVNTESNWNRHDTMDDENPGSDKGIWFNGYNDELTGAAIANTLGAMPYGIYRIEELPCEANEGLRLIDDTVTISKHQTLVELGTYDDKLEPLTPDDSSDEPADDPGNGGKKAGPETGDKSNLLLYSLMVFLALVEAGLLTVIKKNDRLCTEEIIKR